MLNLSSTQTSNHAALSPCLLDAVVETEWRRSLPVLTASGLSLRELRQSDAPSLHAMLTAEEVARFISPPPSTVDGFARFIAWTAAKRAEGKYVCFGIVPAGQTHAVGLIQLRALDPAFETGELGFAIGSAFWGTGLFISAAHLVLDFVFTAMPTRRIEAQAVVENERGNGALKKLGARCEAVLRQSFSRQSGAFDQRLWSILRDNWRTTKATRGHHQIH